MRTEHTLIFKRYTREDCGLPPKDADLFGDKLRVWTTLLVLALLAGAAWLGGRMHANYRELWTRQLPAAIAQAGNDAEARSALLRRGAMFAAALPERPRLRRDLAFAAVTAAEYAPNRMGYIGNAKALLESLENESTSTSESAGAAIAGTIADETPLETLARETTLSGLHEEAGEYREALAALNRAETALSALPDEKTKRSFRLLLVNAQAYCLAAAAESEGGNAARALELSRLAVSSRDELPGGGFASGSAAFVDTLATAEFKNGFAGEAAEAQRLALGLAGSRGLEVYLRHFDTFVDTARKGGSHVQ